MDISERRVVVTGIGLLAPNGLTVDSFWESLCAGRSSAAPITHFDAAKLPTRIACELKGFDAGNYIDPKKAKRLDPSLQFGVIAAKLAFADAGLHSESVDPSRVSIFEGTSVGGMRSTLEGNLTYMEKGYRAMSPFGLINAYCGGGSSEIALELGLPGRAVTICTACSSGNDAIGFGLQAIRDDESDIVIAGATEAPIVGGYVGIFSSAKSLARGNDNPQTAMKPFDRKRDGFLLGEGAAFVVLEELSHALARNARIYAEVVGQGSSCEAYHSVAQNPEGVGIFRAMQKAMRVARMTPDEVDYINAHGSATESNDLVETRAIKRLFGTHAHRVAISGTKPITGHLAGAAGALESVICVLSVHRKIIPPTINLTEPEDGCDLDYTPNVARPYPVRVAMNLNAGFGGKNSCLILREFIN